MEDLYLIGKEVGIMEDTGEAIAVSKVVPERRKIARKMDLPLW
jgi:hypothetical protein